MLYYTITIILCAQYRFDTHVMMGLAHGKVSECTARLALAQGMIKVLLQLCHLTIMDVYKICVNILDHGELFNAGRSTKHLYIKKGIYMSQLLHLSCFVCIYNLIYDAVRIASLQCSVSIWTGKIWRGMWRSEREQLTNLRCTGLFQKDYYILLSRCWREEGERMPGNCAHMHIHLISTTSR